MPSLDGRIKDISEQVLKRPLTDEEELEMLRISEVMGMSNVQSFLFLLLVFKLHEDATRKQIKELSLLKDEMKEKFDELGALYERVDAKLQNSIERILGEGAREIGRDVGTHVAEGAKEILGVNGDYHFLRGQVWTVFLMSVFATVSYWLGAAKVFSAGQGAGTLDTLANLPSGWIAFVCGSMYAYMWGWDHWDKVRGSLYYKAVLAMIAVVLVMIAVYLL
jgi:hypothetical protein